VEGETLHTSRPLTAPEPVRDLIESAVYAMTDGQAYLAGVTSVELVIESSEVSETPIGDGITADTVQPLPEHGAVEAQPLAGARA
jgi:hypothetical protein